MQVVKASGEKEEFDSDKIIGTCLRAGASRETAQEILKIVREEAYDGISTKKILMRTLQLLKERHPGAASRYDLKRGIMSLGPTGFPFEKYFAEVLQRYGYETKVDQNLEGECAEHEIDIIARKKDKSYMIECKYHNETGIYTGLKVVMYTYARFLDLEERFDGVWLACNTKLSYAARDYASCQGIETTCWRYPKSQSLVELVEKKKLYPITILKSVNQKQKQKLCKARLTLVDDLLDLSLRSLKEKTGINEKILKKMKEEGKSILYK